MPVVESSVICVAPLSYCAVQFRTFATGTLPDQTRDHPMTHTFACRPPQGSLPVNFRTVCSGPAPRSVTLLMPLKVMPAVRLYVPAARETTPPPVQAAIAALMSAAVAPASSEAHVPAARSGMPPATPAPLQSTRRLAARTSGGATP